MSIDLAIKINDRLYIPRREVKFTFSRSSGPGGQNVNKVNTRVTLRFDIDASRALTEQQKALIRHKLASKISHNGVLMVNAGRHRTQKANRDAAIRRFAELIAQALAKKAHRKKTRLPRFAKERRLKAKKHRGRIKAMRAKKFDLD